MVAEISIEELTLRLNDIFCKKNKEEKRYSEVWLSEVDFGGLYQTNMVVVNVKAEHLIESCNAEIRYIITKLFKELEIEFNKMIWRVNVFNKDQNIHCSSDGMMVYPIENKC